MASVLAEESTPDHRNFTPSSILMQLTASPYGGVETHVYYLSLALREAGAPVTLVSQRLFDLNSEWRDQLVAKGVSIVAPPSILRRLPGHIGLLGTRLFLAAMLRGKRFDVVVGHGHGAAFRWMKRYVGSGGLFLWHEHWYGVPTRGDDYAEAYTAIAPARLNQRMARMVESADVIITGCTRSAQNLRLVQGVTCPIAIIPPITVPQGMVPAVDRDYTATSHLHIGMVARHGFGKGTAILLRVWKDLDIGAATLHLYGPISGGDFAVFLEDYRSDPTIVIHGAFDRDALPCILAELDLGLMLSVEEGYGLVPLEYMAAGVPFVMTDVGAAQELTASTTNALLVPVSEDGVKMGIKDMVRALRAGKTSRVAQQQRYWREFPSQQVIAEHLRSLLDRAAYWNMVQ